MRINCLIEGGVGDLILATRFIAAVREAYPDSYVSVFVNNDNNEKFNTFLNKHWGHLWQEFFPNVERVSKDFKITSQFGRESYNAALGNIEEGWYRKIMDADKFYNFHLDSLRFTEYSDIPWLKYVRHVPKPLNLVDNGPMRDNLVVANLYARPEHFSAISREQSDAILSNLRENHEVVVLAPNEEARDEFYGAHRDITIVSDLDKSLSIISKSAVGVSIDSGLRCMFYPFGKSCYTLCKLSNEPFEVAISHVARWYMWPENILPINTNPSYIAALVENGLANPACLLYPQYTAHQIDSALLKRKYD